MNDFFANAIDDDVIDSTISAFNNMSYDITDKQRTKWRKKKSKTSKSENHSNPNHKAESRFIPIRDENKFDQQQTYQNKDDTANLIAPTHSDEHDTDSKRTNDYKSCLKSSLLPSSSSQSADNDSKTSSEKILSFKTKAPLAEDGYINNLRVLYTASTAPAKKKSKNVRYIAKTAERVLDAPDLMDDYYVNVLHWGSPNNIIAIGLGSSVYLWDSASGDINLLTDYNENSDNETYVCSVRWNHNSQYIAVGTSDNIVTLYDSATKKALRKLHGHSSRIGALSWNHSILSSGSADSSIRNNDVRQKKYLISAFNGHEQEICGLTWNNNVNGRYLASGSNDNKCSVWEMRMHGTANGNNALYEFTESLSAVKALAFCSWNNNLLATGGGSGDRKIRIYNMTTGGLCNSVDAQSQVTSLIWNPFEKELLSSHGFSKNQLSIWKYPSLQKTHDLTGHNARVLHTTLSPNGQMVCSAAADETLRFWNVFQSQPETQRRGGSSSYTSNQNKNKLNLRIRGRAFRCTLFQKQLLQRLSFSMPRIIRSLFVFAAGVGTGIYLDQTRTFMPRVDNLVHKLYDKWSPQIHDIIDSEAQKLKEFRDKNDLNK